MMIGLNIEEDLVHNVGLVDATAVDACDVVALPVVALAVWKVITNKIHNVTEVISLIIINSMIFLMIIGNLKELIQ